MLIRELILEAKSYKSEMDKKLSDWNEKKRKKAAKKLDSGDHIAKLDEDFFADVEDKLWAGAAELWFQSFKKTPDGWMVEFHGRGHGVQHAYEIKLSYDGTEINGEVYKNNKLYRHYDNLSRVYLTDADELADFISQSFDGMFYHHEFK
jgi:hypothetical protein